MLRKLFAFSVLAVMLAGVTVAADEDTPRKKGPGARGFDKGKLFEKMDVDGKGAVTKEQFLKFMASMKGRAGGKGPGGKKIPPEKMEEIMGKVFDRFDTNGDGKVSKEEYEKGKLGGGKVGGFKGKKKPAAE